MWRKDAIDTEEKLNFVLWVLITVGALIALYAVYQYIIGVEMDAAWVDEESFDITTRAYATFSNPNVLGEYLILVGSLGGRDDLEDEKLVRQIILYRLLRCDLSGSCGNGLPWGNAWADVLGRTFRAAFRKAADPLGVVLLLLMPLFCRQACGRELQAPLR